LFETKQLSSLFFSTSSLKLHMMNYSYILFIIFITWTAVVSCDPIISSISPSFGLQKDITIIGTGFSSTLNVLANTVSTTNFIVESDTKIICTLPTDQTGLISFFDIIVVDNGNVQSNILPYYLIELNPVEDFVQINSFMYIYGKFQNIPMAIRNQILAQAKSDLSVLIPISYENDTTLSFQIDVNIARGELAIYDGSTSAASVWLQPIYAPVVSSMTLGLKELELNGFALDNSLVKIESEECLIKSKTETFLVCYISPGSMTTREFTIYITDIVTGKTTHQVYNLWKELTFHLDVYLMKGNFTVPGYEPGHYFNPTINGLTASGIPVYSIVDDKYFMIDYPLDAQCGYSFVASDPVRLTNSLFACPKAEVELSWPVVENNDPWFYMVGKFLNPFVYGTQAQIGREYLVRYGNKGVNEYETCIENVYTPNANDTYTVGCRVPELTTAYYGVQSIYGRGLEISLIRANPVIVSSTSTFFGLTRSITITGSKFTLFFPVVTIGGKTCLTPVQSQDASEIVCTFVADVPYTDINVPLEVVVSMGIDQSVKDTKSVFYYAQEPTIISATSTLYGTPGTVTIQGTNFMKTDNVAVTIGESYCTNPLVLSSTTITCEFQSNTFFKDYDTPLDVYVSLEPYHNTTNAVFYYTKPLPISVTSATSTQYLVPGQVTITGTNFVVSKFLYVIVGYVYCTDPVVTSSTTITCQYDSSLRFIDYDSPLNVFVYSTMYVNASKMAFYYAKPPPLNIVSITSTVYGVPTNVTITGSNFHHVPNNLLVTRIGGSVCSNMVITNTTTSDSKITCLFKSDVKVQDFNTALDVYVGVGLTFNDSKPLFLYIKPGKTCPINNINGQICSGNGQCNSQFTCTCDKGWESYDCSIKDYNTGDQRPIPDVNPNHPGSSITTPSGTIFDIGVVLINEIDKDNNIIQSYNIINLGWSNITKQDNQYSYTTTLGNNNNIENSKSTLNVKLSINNLDERVYYNFAGDIIPILPKSIKYQVELQDYSFSASLNTMEFIFKSGIIKERNECFLYNESSNTQLSGDSIRSIQMTLNGESLIGTFSDRIVLDNRPSYNQVYKLTDNQITQYNLNNKEIYISIKTISFKKSIIVDPNFGVLILSKPEQEYSGKCNDNNNNKKKFESWKIGLIVAGSVVGVALAVTTVLLIRKRRVVKDFNAKLQKFSK